MELRLLLLLLTTLLLAVLARLLGREEEEGFSGSFSKADTVYRTPANGEKMVLTHMSKRLYASRATFFTAVRETLVMMKYRAFAREK